MGEFVDVVDVCGYYGDELRGGACDDVVVAAGVDGDFVCDGDGVVCV